MIETVEVMARGNLLTLDLEGEDESLLVEEITGLDPVTATISSSSYATKDGGQYQSSRRETRNIVFKIGLEPDWVTETVKDLRDRLYSVFMPKSEVSLRFHTSEGLEADTVGFVESFECPLFVEEPEAVISLLCMDPDFWNATPDSFSANTVLTEATRTVSYTGTIETGFTLTVNVNRNVSDLTVYNQRPDGTLEILEFAMALVAGDILKIYSMSGDKGATLTRAGVDSSALYAISPQSQWLQFFPGDNLFRVYSDGAAIPYTVDWTTKYGGL